MPHRRLSVREGCHGGNMACFAHASLGRGRAHENPILHGTHVAYRGIIFSRSEVRYRSPVLNNSVLSRQHIRVQLRVGCLAVMKGVASFVLGTPRNPDSSVPAPCLGWPHIFVLEGYNTNIRLSLWPIPSPPEQHSEAFAMDAEGIRTTGTT